MSKSAKLRAAAGALLAGILAISLAQTPRAEESGEVIKAAVYNNSTLAYQDEDGVWRGTDVECLTNVAQRAGFRVEFIDSANDADFLGNLDNGTYDIVADVVKTPEREADYLFSDTALGTKNNNLAVRADDDRWDYGNIEQISRMRVGVIASYANNGEFRQWCALRGVTPQIIEFENIGMMTAALSAGEIDGEVYSTMYGKGYTREFRTVMEFLPEAYYFVFRKDDIALKNMVDAALTQIIVENRDYLTNLNNRYSYEFGGDVVPLSAEEKDYAARHRAVSVAVLTGDEPYYSKAADGSDRGIIPDYYALLSEYSGLDFSYVSYPSQQAAVDAVNGGETDVLGVFSSGLISASQSGLTLTEGISTVSNVLLTRTGADISQIKTVAAKQRALDGLRDSTSVLAGATMRGFEGDGSCFEAMSTGTVDAAILPLPSAAWLLNQTTSSAYSITPLPGMTLELCSAVRDGDRTLCSILNKSIAATRESFDGIVTNDTLPEDNWKTTLNRIPSYTVVIVAGVLLALVIGLVWALVMLKRRQAERASVLEAQAVTERERLQLEAIQRSTDEHTKFFSNISHDMRTPLNAVLGFTREARRDDITPEQRDGYLAKVETSGRLLLDLINDTLTISKISSGKLTLNLQPCSTTELIEAVASPIREAAEKKDIEFTVDDSAMPEQIIMADRLNIEKIFLNLLSNAVKYTPEGGHIRYAVVQEPQSGDRLDYVMTVSDDGIGMSAEYLPHIFEPFSQEMRSGYESGGTGLGLSIVKQLVDLMGGTVEVQSESGVGTSFTVRLHFSAADADDVPAQRAEGVPAADLSGRKVLLCEDNEMNMEIALSLLNEKNIAADTALDGRESVKKFAESAEGEYSAVLMDIRMPVMNGYEATGAIRALEREDAKTVPIIAMTADAFADDVQRCLDAGMNGHIAKPIDPQQLYGTLAAFIKQQS